MNAWDKPHAELEKILDRRHVFYSVDADMNDIAIMGKAVIEMPYDGFWGEGEDYRSEVVENPTWLDLAVLADAAIRTTGDYHHSFFEGIRYRKDEKYDVEVYHFIMGS